MVFQSNNRCLLQILNRVKHSTAVIIAVIIFKEMTDKNLNRTYGHLLTLDLNIGISFSINQKRNIYSKTQTIHVEKKKK